MLEVFTVAKENGALVMVHAEGYDQIRFMVDRLEREGSTQPHHHATSRPELVEREATHRAISHAELIGIPIMIVHVSGREAIEQIRWARGHGLSIFAETCPQYLFLTAEDLGIDDSYLGARCVCSPPPRDKANQQRIWEGLADGLFTVFSSDHAPFRYEDPQGKKIGGQEVPFRHIPNGIPGLETRLPLLYSEGVLGGRITLQKFVELTATNPAKAYGLHPRKGTIAVGSDADLVIFDPNATQTISAATHHSKMDYSLYEGMEVTGVPTTVLVRGEPVLVDRQFVGTPGSGRFLKRDLYQSL
jgi:dihydropyrimidinase